MAHSVVTQSKFSRALTECHHKSLRGLAKCFWTAKSWEIQHCMIHLIPTIKSLLHSQKLLGNSQLMLPNPEWLVLLMLAASWNCRRGDQGALLPSPEKAIECKSGMQTTVASSSTKAKLIAAFAAAETARCLQFILQELGLPQSGSADTHAGNQTALSNHQW